MAGSLTIPVVFAGLSGTQPPSLLDQDFNAIRDYINPREITVGTEAARPAAGVSGRWYYATDTERLYVDTGSAWTFVGSPKIGLARVVIFTTSGTWTPGSNRVRLLCVRAVGGGGAGGGAPATGAGQLSGGGGGASGAYAQVIINAAGLTSLAIAIGAGGTGVNGAAGNAGGTTTVTSGTAVSITCGGGGGGGSAGPGTSLAAQGGVANAASVSGSAVLASVQWTGEDGIPFTALSNFLTGYPAGAAGQMGSQVVTYLQPPGTPGHGQPGRGFGGGGAGALNNASTPAATGGTGANGIVIIEEYE